LPKSKAIVRADNVSLLTAPAVSFPYRGFVLFSERIMARAATCSLAAALVVSFAAIFLAACDVETTGSAQAASQPSAQASSQASSPAEKMAERFAETSAATSLSAAPQSPAAVTAAQKSDIASKAADDAQQLAAKKRAAEVAAKRADEKAKKAAAAAAAATSAEQLKADEAQMLAEARAEAEARRLEMEAASVEREKAEVAAIAAEKAKADAQAESERLAAAQKKADELRVAEERRLAEEKLIAEAKVAEQLRKQAADDAAMKAAEMERRAEQTRQAEIKTLEARREAEAKALTESLRRAEANREAKTPLALPDPSILAALPASTQSSSTQPSQQDVSPRKNPEPERLAAIGQPQRPLSRATILVIMQPGNKGIRRFEKTADPVLCVKDGCYVSEGAGQPALFKQRNQVLGFTNTLGARAGACQRSLGCVFRDVDLAASGGFIQPVDMKVLAHDRRETQTVEADSGCRVEAGRLSCSHSFNAGSYRFWVVPEALADRAGAAALEQILRDGLPASQSAGLQR
jgi:hypothetical protein